MYRTLFGEAYPFSYDFEDLARYYARLRALMSHWRASFGEGFNEIVYEDLVGEPAARRRRPGALTAASRGPLRPSKMQKKVACR